MSNNSFTDGKNHLHGFFLIIALYVIVISILAIFTTTEATEYGPLLFLQIPAEVCMSLSRK